MLFPLSLPRPPAHVHVTGLWLVFPGFINGCEAVLWVLFNRCYGGCPPDIEGGLLVLQRGIT